MKNKRVLWGILGSLCFISCANPEKDAGRPGVDETSNGITAQLFVHDGSVARNAKVHRVSCDFDASLDTTLIADSLGKVFLDTLDWNGKLCLDIRGDSVAARVSYDRRDSVQLDRVILEKWVRVRGQIDLPPNLTQAWVEVFGIQGRVKTQQGGTFVWDSLPSGMNHMRSMLIDTPLVISESHLQLTPGSDTNVIFEETPQDREAWSKDVRVVLNTGSSGSNLKEDLLGFPVLLWLDSSSFPTGAALGGADLRVEKDSGIAVPFEIEYWDAQARLAKLWVLMDTLRKNDSLQEIHFRWGNVNAIAVSSPGQVFDTTLDWTGVWHLSESYRDSLNRFRVPDATPWKNDGVVHGYINWLESPLGNTIRFDGIPNAIAFEGNHSDIGRSSFTWELWMQTPDMGREIFHRGDIDTLWEPGEKKIFLGVPGKPFSASFGWNPIFMGRRTPDENVYVSCSTQVVSEEWIHLVLRRTIGKNDSGVTEWFVDGAQVGESSALDLLEPDQGRDSIYLGVDLLDGPRLFKGTMAEFRMSRVARSAEWIRMDHFQQDPSNRSWIKIVP